MWVLRRVLARRLRWAGEGAEVEEEEEEEEEEAAAGEEEAVKECGEAKVQRRGGLRRQKLPRREQHKLHSQVSSTWAPWNEGGSLQQRKQSPERMAYLVRTEEMLFGRTWNGARPRRRIEQLGGRGCLAGCR